MGKYFNVFCIFTLIWIVTICCSCTKDNDTFSDVQKQEEISEISSFDIQRQEETSTILNRIENFNVSNEFTNVMQNNFINEIELNTLLEQADDESLLFWSYCDYDGDKRKEVFAVTGKEDISFGANLWFINSKQIYYLGEVLGDTVFVFAVSDSTKYLCISSERFENYSRIWGVQDGSAVEMPISNVGQRFSFDERNDFKITQSALDGMSLGGGHTHKQYYFYYDHNDKCFYEYGGTAITVNELLQFENAEKILNAIIDKGGEIKSILKRNNYIINVNYTIPESEALQAFDWNYNITLKLNENSVYVINENEGVYLPALVPEIAQYP